MAWSGSGTFSRVFGASGWTNDKNNGVKILASRHDTNDQDLADGINACLTRNNESKPTSDFLPAADNTFSLGSASFRWLLNAQSPALLGQVNSFTGSTNGSRQQDFINTNAGASAFSALRIIGDSTGLIIGQTSSGFTGPAITGGPAGQSSYIVNNANVTFSIGTNNTERIRIAGDGSIINLQATAVQVNGVPINTLFAFKSAATNRNTTTVNTADPDLSLTLTSTGRWRIEVFLPVQTTTTNTQGFKWVVGGTATINPLQNGQITHNVNAVSTVAAFASGVGSAHAVVTVGGTDCIVAQGVIDVTVIGTVNISWAQNSSSANNTSLIAGAFLRVIKCS